MATQKKTVTARTKKAAAAKKTSYDPAKAKAQREARKAKKAKLLSIATRRQKAVDEIAKLAISDDITGDELIAQIQPLREDIERADREIEALTAKAASGKAATWEPINGGHEMQASWIKGLLRITARYDTEIASDGIWHAWLTLADDGAEKPTTVFRIEAQTQAEAVSAVTSLLKSQKAIANRAAKKASK